MPVSSSTIFKYAECYLLSSSVRSPSFFPLLLLLLAALKKPSKISSKFSECDVIEIVTNYVINTSCYSVVLDLLLQVLRCALLAGMSEPSAISHKASEHSLLLGFRTQQYTFPCFNSILKVFFFHPFSDLVLCTFCFRLLEVDSSSQF